MAWRYFATRLNGNGTESPLADALPLLDVEIHDDLSGSGGLAAALAPESRRLQGPDGRPILEPWSTAIYAEKDGIIRGGGILRSAKPLGPVLDLDVLGFPGYLHELPWIGPDYTGIQVDPLDVVRLVWAHAQAHTGGDLGLVVDEDTSPVRIGTKAETNSFTTGTGQDVSFESGPVVLAEWKTHNLGEVVDNLAKDTPFDYRVEHIRDGDAISHRLHLGYPRIGRRRHDLTFVVGQNVYTVPEIGASTEYADEVLVLGAGEGRRMVRSVASRPSTKLRRVAVVEAKSVTSNAGAARLGQREVAHRTGEPAVASTLEVSNHPSAPLGSYSPGDEILVRSTSGWGAGLETWHRIISTTIRPATDVATLTLARST